jgi:putative DNA methylase
MTYKKKLIDVALPLVAINNESLRRKTKAPKGWPTTFHKWWAQRPLAAARAVIFAQMVDDPSSNPDLFPTEELQDKERERLFVIIENLVKWENTTDSEVLRETRDEIWKSWRRTCDENVGHPKANTLFNPNKLPPFWDPFAGGGSLPLSAQWLGLESFATDLNPVAVLLNKALIEIPSVFASRKPIYLVNEKSKDLIQDTWVGASGLAQDVRYYSELLREQAEERIGHLYQPIEITDSSIINRDDLRIYLGQKLKVIAYIWARTVASPDPAFKGVHVPLASTFILSTKAGKEFCIKPVIEGNNYSFDVRIGVGKEIADAKKGTKLSRGANFGCILSGSPISSDYIKTEGKAGRLGIKMMAIVADGGRGRLYLPPTPQQENTAIKVEPSWKPEIVISGSTQYIGVKPYGMDRFDQLFTNRQLVALETLSNEVNTLRERIRNDAIKSGFLDECTPLYKGGTGASAYSDAVIIYLACLVDRVAYYGSTLVGWLPKDSALGPSMPRQAIAMSWDFAEANPLEKSSGGITTCANAVANYLDVATTFAKGFAFQADAQSGLTSADSMVISTDPPYYDNVPYADLSDYFYVWLRRQLKEVLPDLFTTLATPKSEELVAFAYRHKEGKKGAETFFLDGMTKAMNRLAVQSHPAFPITIYYAFKQSEDEGDDGTASTGWETFLSAVIAAGFAISGTWPLRTEGETRMRGMNSNALASSIILVCRPRSKNALTVSRREFIAALRNELPKALAHLQQGNIAPVDLAQAAIGPGMGVYSRFQNVVDAQGKSISVREGLALINQTLDESLAAQEGDFDGSTRWALTWFEQMGFADGDFGTANSLAQAKNTGMDVLVEAGIIVSGKGKVRLLQPGELSPKWDHKIDKHLTVWEMVHQLIRVLELGGESAASVLVSKLGSHAETARELCYRLYSLCERKKRANEAMSYNGLVQSWPEITRLASDKPVAVKVGTSDMFEQE